MDSLKRKRFPLIITYDGFVECFKVGICNCVIPITSCISYYAMAQTET